MKKAEWIWLNKQPESDEYGAFYDTFHVDKIAKTTMRISVAGDYNVYINGTLVAFGQYADFAHYKVYDELDVSSYLKEGENEVLVIAWYIGKSFSTYKDCGAGLLFEMENERGEILAYSRAGMRSALAQGFVSHKNKIITVQLGFSYCYDSRTQKYVWESAVSAAGFGQNLIKRPNQKLQLQPITEGELIDEAKQLYDLGRESCGFLSIKFKANAGEKIVVAFGEHIVDGGVRHFIDGRDFTVELIGNGEWVEFLGSFRRLGCRYLQIIEGEAELGWIGLRETEYPLTIKPYQIDNPRRKQIYETSLRTLQLCLHEHYEDCPWREQSMYIMDTRNQMLCGYYGFDNAECVASAIRLIAAGQKENGLFELCFPADVPITIPSFSLAFATMVLEYTQFTQDTALALEMLPKIEKMLSFFLDKVDESGLFKTVSEEGIWHFYEWAGVLDGAFFELDGSKKVRNEYDVLINAFLSIALDKTATLFALTQNYQKVFHYQDLRIALNKKMHETFYVQATGLYQTYSDREDYSQLANALCVLAEVCDKEQAEIICEKLADNNTDWVKNTLSMSIFRYDALLKTNKEKYTELILEDIDATYGYMLDCGATSFWETIKGEEDFHYAGSLCHGWSALPVYYYNLFGVCGDKKPPLKEAFEIRDIPSRNDYAESVLQYVNACSKETHKNRDAILALPLEERRKALETILGKPLMDDWGKTALLKKELILVHNGVRSTRYTFLLNGTIPFSGILYEKEEKPTKKEKLIIALHGGGGSSEILGDLFVDSSNYNHMVNRVLRTGVKVFAPQLLLWNSAIYGSENDRGWLNRRLLQLGGSITAFEVQCLRKMLDWWMEDEETDTQRVGVVGLSYGGMYALHFGALDTRVFATYSSCWFSDRTKHNWHDWTYFNAENTFFDTEVASLVLPRKLYIEVAKEDEAFPASDCQFERARLENYVKQAGHSDVLTFKEFDGKHELDLDDTALDCFVRDIING
ncbi:MAG: hypothetical protein E7349_00885 [Clostridiales bacterium]|nr:hypothetical protein [Clostridiales bacterium]